MWHTSEGDRLLEAAEARLFKAGVTGLVERVKEETRADGGGYSIALFDELTWSQRLAVLESVATHLLTESGHMPELTAVNEAAIGAVFDHISFEIDVEIEGVPSASVWRQLVFDACHECFGDELRENDESGDEEGPEEDADYLPESANNDRPGQWHPLVQSLADRILWDRDYELMGEFLDEPPEKAAMLRQIMGIGDDYFATAAVDLHSDQEARETLRRLAGILQ
ncbi:MAG: hypothetical protein GY903_13390 [Fuerstiella sp.]|nr:hypothetical protein [Fuerstiella sp.]MCP4855479.1 hypothetical protein [Fuerstiella sp.]